MRNLIEEELSRRKRRELTFHLVLFASAFASGAVVGGVSSGAWQLLLPGFGVEPTINYAILFFAFLFCIFVSIAPGFLADLSAKYVGPYSYVKPRFWSLVVTGVLAGAGVYLVARGTFGATQSEVEASFFALATWFFLFQVICPIASAASTMLNDLWSSKDVSNVAHELNGSLTKLGIAIRGEHYDEAISIAQKIIDENQQTDPIGTTIAWDKLAKMSILRGEWKQATENLQKAFDIWESLAERRILEGVAREKAKMHSLVIRHIERGHGVIGIGLDTALRLIDELAYQ